MTDLGQSERRDFVRVAVSLPVRYKFLTPGADKRDVGVYDGTTSNISAGGILLRGKIPSNDWLVEMLLQKVVLGINMLLPGTQEPVKALARVAWVEGLTAQAQCSMGLLFKEVSRETQDRIVQFIIRSQMP